MWLGRPGINYKLSLIHRAYTDKRAVQAAYHLCMRAGGTIGYWKLLKILYIADRFSFEKRNYPITFDRLCSMEKGPLTSGIYDRIKPIVGVNFDEIEQHWAETFTSSGRWALAARIDPGTDELSQNDIALLDEAYDFWKSFPNQEAFEDWLHNLPEYENPGKSSKPIRIPSLLKALGMNKDDIKECIDELLVDVSLQEMSTL